MSKAYSWAPFDIPKEMLQEIIAQLNVTPEILPVFFSFRRQTNRLEEAFSDSVWVSSSKDLTGEFYVMIPSVTLRKVLLMYGRIDLSSQIYRDNEFFRSKGRLVHTTNWCLPPLRPTCYTEYMDSSLSHCRLQHPKRYSERVELNLRHGADSISSALTSCVSDAGAYT